MKQKGFTPAIIILVIAIVGVLGYFGYKNYWPKISSYVSPQNYADCIKSPGSVVQQSFPAVCVAKSGARFTQPLTPEEQKSVSPPVDTSNWKTYTNSIANFSFKYPSGWTIDTKGEKGDEKGENIQIKLTKGKASIQIYADMVGIGGVGRDFDGTSVQVDNQTLYKYTIDNSFDGTKMVGVTDSLKQSLGLFQISGKTYSITLTYPNTYSTQQITDLEKEFDQILSTFKFNSKGADY